MFNFINFILGVSITINLFIIASIIIYFQNKKEKKEDKILSRSTDNFDFWR